MPNKRLYNSMNKTGTPDYIQSWILSTNTLEVKEHKMVLTTLVAYWENLLSISVDKMFSDELHTIWNFTMRSFLNIRPFHLVRATIVL